MELYRALVKSPDKKYFRKVAEVFGRKNKTLKWFYWIGLIITLIAGPVFAFISYYCHFSEWIIFYPLGIYFLIYYYFAPVSFGNRLYKSQSKKNLNKDTTYCFSDSEIKITTVDMTTSLSYSGIEDFYETDEIYCLFVNKSFAYTIPKNAVENLCGYDFKTFIQNKIGKPAVYVKKKSTGKSTAKLFGIMTAGIILICIAFGLAEYILTENPKTFTFEDYSITLDQSFYDWQENDDTELALTNDLVYFTLEKYSDDDLYRAFFRKDVSIEDFAGDYKKEYKADMLKINEFTYYLTFSDSYDDYDYYNAMCIQQIDGVFWVSQLFCDKSHEIDYAQSFLKWFSSIKYKAENI